MKKFIPAKLYQVITLTAFFSVLALSVYWVFTERGLYAWLAPFVGGLPAAILTLFGLLIPYIVIMLGLRSVTLLNTKSMKTLMDEEGASSVKELFARKIAEGQRMAEKKPVTRVDQIKRHRQLAQGGLVVGVVAILASIILYGFGTIWMFGIIMGIMAPVLAAWHAFHWWKLSRE